MLKDILDEELQADSVVDFILRLSSATNLSESDKVEAIKSQLKGFEQNRFYGEVFDSFSPDRFYSGTKSLPDSSKQILFQALKEYTQDNKNDK